jgi:hypothetical protein
MKNNFKSLILGAGLATGLVASSGAAMADTFGPMDTSGYGEIFGLLSWDSDADGRARKQDYAGLGGGGHVNFWLSDSYTLQIDGTGSFFRNDDVGYRLFAVEGLAHAGWRNPDQGYLGAFGGLLSYGYSGEDNSYDQWVVGGEGAVYLDMVTLFVQGGFMDSFDDDTNGSGPGASFTDTWFVRGGVRYFATPNLKLEASGGLLQGNEYARDVGDCCRVDMPFWKLEGEYKPDDSRVSWFASYGGYSENEVNYEHTNHTVMAGLRIHFGQDTLLSFDRSGASLDFLDTRMLIQAFDH